MSGLEQGGTSEEFLILEPKKSAHFTPDKPQGIYEIVEGSASVQEWRRHEEGIHQGPVMDVKQGTIFLAGGGTEMLMMNLGDTPVKYQKIPETPTRQQPA